MFFKKKQPVDREELELQIFRTKIELRRIMEKYEVMLQRELRLARSEQAAGVARPSNFEKMRTIAGLLATTKKAHQEMDKISTADELNRTTAELSAALQGLNRISASAAKPDGGALRRGVKQMESADKRLERDLRSQSRVMDKVTPLSDGELEAMLSGEPLMAEPVMTEPERPLTDEELADMNADALRWLEEM